MKEHKIDQLFRQKLQEHRVNPTPAAWDQLSSSLNSHRRKRSGAYYAAAAVLALLLAVGWLWLQHGNPAGLPPQGIANTDQPAATNPSADFPAPLLRQEAAGKPETARAVDHPAAAQAAPALLADGRKQDKDAAGTIAKIRATAQEVETPSLHQPEELPQTELAQAVPEGPPSLNPTAALPAQMPDLTKHSFALAQAETVVIRYEAASLEKQKETEQENTSEKIISVLQKVKNGEISLANLRSAKDNLLSGRFNKP